MGKRTKDSSVITAGGSLDAGPSSVEFFFFFKCRDLRGGSISCNGEGKSHVKLVSLRKEVAFGEEHSQLSPAHGERARGISALTSAHPCVLFGDNQWLKPSGRQAQSPWFRPHSSASWALSQAGPGGERTERGKHRVRHRPQTLCMTCALRFTAIWGPPTSLASSLASCL